jgi:hypothetical protein
LKDYVTSKGLSDEEERYSLVMFTSAEDPVIFEEAYKSLKWREAMDMKMRAIITLPDYASPLHQTITYWLHNTLTRLATFDSSLDLDSVVFP